jgi:hypothetical protein
LRLASTTGLTLVCVATAHHVRAQDPTPPQGSLPSLRSETVQATPAARPAGLQWTVGDYTVKLGGYVKVDLIHDFDEIGSTDSFDPRTIPTDDESDPGMNTRLHARQSRLNVDVRGPTDIGPMRLFVEGDFFSDQNGFRMRHAFGTVAGVLGGQTWSTFMDEDAMPETLDFESPIAFPLIRQAQIRYTHAIEGDSYWAIAVEDPASAIVAPPVPGEVQEATPDVTGRLRWAHGLGHCQLGLFAGTSRFDPDAGPADTVVIYGANLSARIAAGERDHFFTQATYGPGVGRYRGGITAVPDGNGNLDAVEILGLMGAYEHHWCDQWRSTVTYAWADGDLPEGTDPTANQAVSYLAANLIWQFTNKAWCGVEYLYGSLETENGARGEANRVQFALRFDF